MSAVELKERARQIIECLAKLDQSKRPGGGVHGQVIGMEPYVIRTNGDGLQCLYEAQSLLDELLDPFDRLPAPQVALTDALPELPGFIARKVEQAIHDAKHPKGMHTNGPSIAHLEVTLLERLYRTAIEARNQQGDAGWISVDERMPKEGEHVAILYWPYDNHENQQIVGWAEHVEGTFYTHEGDEHHQPSHWFAVPDFPAIEQRKADKKGTV